MSATVWFNQGGAVAHNCNSVLMQKKTRLTQAKLIENHQHQTQETYQKKPPIVVTQSHA